MAAKYSGGRKAAGKGRPKIRHKAKKVVPGPSARAYERANSNASFKRGSAKTATALKVAAVSPKTRAMIEHATSAVGAVKASKFGTRPKGSAAGATGGAVGVVGPAGKETLIGSVPTTPVKPPAFTELKATAAKAETTASSKGKSAAAPGHRKKVLGLKSARTLAPGRTKSRPSAS